MNARAAALLLFFVGPIAAGAQDEAEVPSALVATAPVRQGSLDETVLAYGLTQSASDASLAISVPHAGEVRHLRVVVGQRVRIDDPLFDYVTDPGASLAFQQAVSALKLAQDEQAHAARLAVQKLATQSQLDQANKAIRDAEAEVDEQRRLGGATSSVTLRAAFTGVITAVSASNGDHVQANAQILTLAETDRLVAVLGVEPEYAASVVPGMAVKLSPLAQPGRPIDATVASVGGLLDPKTQLIDVVVAIPPVAQSALLPGEHVGGVITVGKVDGWIVPRQAVLTDPKGPYVFQISDGKAIRIDVSLTGQSGDRTAVSGALDPSRMLVISGNYELADGTPVREQARQPARNADGPGAAE